MTPFCRPGGFGLETQTGGCSRVDNSQEIGTWWWAGASKGDV